LKKKCLAFDLDDVLSAGKNSGEINNAKAKELLQKLSNLEKQDHSFKLALVSGFSEEAGKKKLEETGLSLFFKPENVFFVDNEYLEAMEEVDRQRYNEKLSSNQNYQDDFFKQKALERLVSSTGLSKEDIVLVGHDLLVDAYYSRRFSGVHVVLLRGSLSLRHEKTIVSIQGLTFIDLEWKQFRMLLLGELPEPDYSFLDRFIQNFLSQELVGNNLLAAGLAGKAKLDAMKKSS
jgi:hypothetical protein